MTEALRIAVAVESAEQRRHLEALALERHGIAGLPVALAGADAPWAAGMQLIPCSPAAGALPGLPSFTAAVQWLAAEGAAGCLLLGDGIGARVVALASDLLGIPLFQLVDTAEQLANLVDRAKARPNLFLLTAADLLPQALEDRRYGSTLLPVGNPRAAELAGGGAGDASAAARARIVDAIRRWRDGGLDPPVPELSIIVPAFREAANLALVCDRLLEALDGSGIAYEILLVDDASPDETYRVALEQMWRSPRIRALTKPPPRGMGNAIRHGLSRARGPVVAITMGDGSDEVGRIPEMFFKVRDGGYGLAIGSRYRHRVNYETVPRLYRFWSWCFRWCTRLLVGLRLSDYTNAFRVYDRRIFSRYGPESGGFEISPETTFKAWFATRRVAEVDVRHLKRAAGQSTFSFLRAGPGYGKILTKAFVNRLTGRWFTLDW